MNLYEVFRWVFVILSTIILCSPLFLLIKHKGTTIRGKDYKKSFPQYSWLPMALRIFLVSWPLLFFIYYLFARPEMNGIGLYGWFISGYGIVLGTITEITQTSYMPISIPLLRFVHGEDAQLIGCIQLLLSIVLVCTSTYLAIKY